MEHWRVSATKSSSESAAWTPNRLFQRAANPEFSSDFCCVAVSLAVDCVSGSDSILSVSLRALTSHLPKQTRRSRRSGSSWSTTPPSHAAGRRVVASSRSRATHDTELAIGPHSSSPLRPATPQFTATLNSTTRSPPESDPEPASPRRHPRPCPSDSRSSCPCARVGGSPPATGRRAFRGSPAARP